VKGAIRPQYYNIHVSLIESWVYLPTLLQMHRLYSVEKCNECDWWFGWMYKEIGATWFKALSRHFPGATEEI